MVAVPRVDARNEPLAVPVRRWWTRLSSAHILIFAAGALAFIANLAVLRPAELPPRVAVAVTDLLPGTVFRPDLHVEYVPMTTDSELLSRWVIEENGASFAGRVVRSRVTEGSVLAMEALDEPGTSDGQRIMSLAIERERAAGGVLQAGDFVDVVAVEAGEARYVETGLEVVAVPDPGAGSFTAGGKYHVVLVVDAESALRLAAAADTSAIQLIRSTGSAAPPAPEAGSND